MERGKPRTALFACISETKMREECWRVEEPKPNAGCVVVRL